MGHYRSEMGFEDKDAVDAAWKEKRLQLMTKNIEQAIHEKGLPRVLAEILRDPLMAKLGYDHDRS